MFEVTRSGAGVERYAALAADYAAMIDGERDPIANAANLAALLFAGLDDLNWAGVYRNLGGELVLGPFQGRPACVRIAFERGVCGAAARTRTVQCVPDVHRFPGHIACDAASQSELVIPLVLNGRLLGVLDLDSPRLARFDAVDVAGCSALADLWITGSDHDPQGR